MGLFIDMLRGGTRRAAEILPLDPARMFGLSDSSQSGGTLGVLRDVTDLKRAEDELRSLSRRLIRAQEEERALLARELQVLLLDRGQGPCALYPRRPF